MESAKEMSFTKITQPWKEYSFPLQGCTLDITHAVSKQRVIWMPIFPSWGFPSGSVVKNLPANAGDMGSIPGLGSSPEEGNGNLLQYSWLGNPMNRRTWPATIHGIPKSRIWLSDWTTTTIFLFGQKISISFQMNFDISRNGLPTKCWK